MADLKVEVFAVGKWNGLMFTRDDLKAIVLAFHSLNDKLKVPLKMGHNDDQPYTDGEPAIGWVTNLELSTDDKLVAHFTDMPDIVFDAIQAKLYRNVSIELDFGVEYKDDYYPYVLTGIALLGADLPAVNTLSDLQAFMSKELSFNKRMVFNTVQGNKQNISSEVFMDKGREKELLDEIESLKRQISIKDKEFEATYSENVQLKKERVEMAAERKSLEDERKLRQEKEERDLLKTQLNAMVDDKKIAPFTRDEYLREYDESQDKRIIMLTVDKLKKTIDSNPAYFGAEQARKEDERKRNEDGLKASEVVSQRTKEYMAKHGEKNYSTAKRTVLLADRDLAEQYKMEG